MCIINFDFELKNYKTKYVYTIDFVRFLAKKHKIAQYKVRNQFDEFMKIAFRLGYTKHRTSEIFMTKRDMNCCPKFDDSWISHIVFN